MSRAIKSPFLLPVVGLAAAGALAASALVAGPAVATSPAATDSTNLTFMVGLNYDRTALLRTAQSVATPGSSSYRHFLTLKEAKSRFGVNQAQRSALRTAATDLGMKVTFSETGLTANLTAPASTWTELFGYEPTVMTSKPPWDAIVYVDPQTGAPAGVPAALKPHVRTLMASTALIPPAPAPTTRAGAVTANADDTPPINTGTPFGPGLDCIPASVQEATYSPNQLHVPYGTKALHDRGLRGEGARIANLGGGYAYTTAFLKHAADCFDFRAPPVRFTGGPGVGSTPVRTSGDDEGNLDIQVIAAVVPQAARIDYVEVAPNALLYPGFIQGMDIVVTRLSPMPDVVTASFGECEPDLSGLADIRAVADDHFALAGLLGVSVLAASGDGGSSGCSQFIADPPASGRGLAVEYPGASPWVTAVGGTRIVLGAGNERVDEVVWNDIAYGGPAQGAGTGGPTLVSSPWYQRPVSAQDRRVVPDVAAHASNYAGWPLAYPIGGELVVIPVGGTSAASPFTAANLALIAAAERKAGRGPLGFVNPMLYELASKPAVYRTAFHDITKGSNQRFIEAGCCTASRGFDQATGLGALTFDELIKVIPKPAPRR